MSIPPPKCSLLPTLSSHPILLCTSKLCSKPKRQGKEPSTLFSHWSRTRVSDSAPLLEQGLETPHETRTGPWGLMEQSCVPEGWALTGNTTKGCPGQDRAPGWAPVGTPALTLPCPPWGKRIHKLRCSSLSTEHITPVPTGKVLLPNQTSPAVSRRHGAVWLGSFTPISATPLARTTQLPGSHFQSFWCCRSRLRLKNIPRGCWGWKTGFKSKDDKMLGATYLLQKKNLRKKLGWKPSGSETRVKNSQVMRKRLYFR